MAFNEPNVLTKMKKLSITTLKNKLWEECKRVVRKIYMVGENTWYCYTCDRLLDEPAKAQTGHFIPSGACGAFLRHDLRNLRIQCYHCNINLGGNGAEFYRRMVKEVGKKNVEQLFIDKNKSIKADITWYLSLIEKYKKL